MTERDDARDGPHLSKRRDPDRAHSVKQRVQSADAQLGQLIEEAQRSGELEHLYGKPLDLDDDSPEWFAKKLLKEAGFSHPLVDRARELDEALDEAEHIVERLYERRAWLDDPRSRTALEAIQRFNERRNEALEDYRMRLAECNRATRDFNLSAPAPMHRRAIDVEQAVQQAAERVRPLPLPTAEPTAAQPRRSFWKRLRRS